jgi:hypothetical protein
MSENPVMQKYKNMERNARGSFVLAWVEGSPNFLG